MEKLQKSLAATILFFFSITALWGVVWGMGTMDHGMEGMTFLCPIMVDQDVACAMGVTEHLTLWKLTFSATLQAGLMLVFLTAFVRFFDKNQLRLLQEKRRFASWIAPSDRRKRESFAMVSNPILQALSQGILAPKVYA